MVPAPDQHHGIVPPADPAGYGGNLAVIPRARDVAEAGPYRWIRHPRYAGEIVSSLGLTIAAHSLPLPSAFVWLGICALQVTGLCREEQLLPAAPARVRRLPDQGRGAIARDLLIPLAGGRRAG